MIFKSTYLYSLIHMWMKLATAVTKSNILEVCTRATYSY